MTTNSSPTWAVEQLHKITRSQRRHPRLWQLSCQLQHQVNILAHQIEDPPPGLDSPFDPTQLLAQITTIYHLCDEMVASITAGQAEVSRAGTTKGENHDRAD